MKNKIFVLLMLNFALSCFGQSGMILRWVGPNPGVNASGNWSDPNNWRRFSGGVAGIDYNATTLKPLQSPRSFDDVRFDDTDIPASITTTITIDQDLFCRNFYAKSDSIPLGTGFKDQTLKFTSSAAVKLNIFGNFELLNTSGSGSYNAFIWDVNGIIIFSATSVGNYTVNFENVEPNNHIRFDSPAGTACH